MYSKDCVNGYIQKTTSMVVVVNWMMRLSDALSGGVISGMKKKTEVNQSLVLLLLMCGCYCCSCSCVTVAAASHQDGNAQGMRLKPSELFLHR